MHIVSGWVDSTSFYSMDAAAKQTYNLLQNPPLRATTHFCHIFPPSINWRFDNPNDPAEKKVACFRLSSSLFFFFLSIDVLQKKYAGSVWAIIK